MQLPSRSPHVSLNSRQHLWHRLCALDCTLHRNHYIHRAIMYYVKHAGLEEMGWRASIEAPSPFTGA